MNPPSKGDLPVVMSTSSSVTFKSTGVPGFANLVNFKEVNCPMITRGGSRRIQINHRGVGLATSGNCTQPIPVLAPSQQEMRAITKKRWSFHSSNQISEVFQMDKAMRPIGNSPNKKRKSSGNEGTSLELMCPLSQDAILMPKPISHTSRNVLTTRQEAPPPRPHPRRMSTGRIMPLRKSESRGSRQRLMDDYFNQIEAMGSAFAFLPSRSKKQSKDAATPDRISTLPDEILLKICKHLPKSSLASLARTSHRFYQIINDETLWKRLCIVNRMLLPEHAIIIMTRKPIYLRMARAWIPDPTEKLTAEDIDTLATASQLLYLDLTSANISASTLALLLKISPKLVKLSLENLPISNEVLEAMMGFAPTIEVLNLTMCFDVNAEHFVKFLNKCQRLTELNIGCMRVNWSAADLTMVAGSLPRTIRLLNISGYRHILDNEHVSLIVGCCPDLLELDISDSQEIKAKSIEYVLELPFLEHLGLSRCYGIEPVMYHALSAHKSLKFLDLFTLFNESSQRRLCNTLPGIQINKFPFSAIARPTVGNKRSSIWSQRVRD